MTALGRADPAGSREKIPGSCESTRDSRDSTAGGFDTARDRSDHAGDSRASIRLSRASGMESRDGLVAHFVHAVIRRDWCVDRSLDSLLRSDTFPDGLVGSPAQRGEAFRRFDPDFRSRDDSLGTGD